MNKGWSTAQDQGENGKPPDYYSHDSIIVDTSDEICESCVSTSNRRCAGSEAASLQLATVHNDVSNQTSCAKHVIKKLTGNLYLIIMLTLEDLTVL